LPNRQIELPLKKEGFYVNSNIKMRLTKFRNLVIALSLIVTFANVNMLITPNAALAYETEFVVFPEVKTETLTSPLEVAKNVTAVINAAKEAANNTSNSEIQTTENYVTDSDFKSLITSDTPCSFHTWNYETVGTACEGYSYVRTCSVCGASEICKVSEGIGHDYKSEITQSATYTSTGIKTFTCSRCGDSYTEVIEKLPASSLATQTGYRRSGSLTMSKLTQSEMVALLNQYPVKTYSDSVFVTNPSTTAPYSTGELKQSVIQDTINRFNAWRTICGLPSTISDSTFNTIAQYGAVLSGARGTISHTPSKPADMNEEFYNNAYAACSSSNLAAHYPLIAVADEFFEDSDPNNATEVGHRRWMLSPKLYRVGYGYAETDWSYGNYHVLKIFDKSGAGCDYDFLSYPSSGNFPADIAHAFNKDTSWSISFNPEKFQTPHFSEIKIYLTDSKGKTYTFSSSNLQNLFAINTDTYGGINNCIIFRPSGVTKYEGLYTVKIEGLKASNGQPINDFVYQVNFFNTASVKVSSISSTAATNGTEANVSVYVDNNKLSFDQSPYMKSGRVMLPMRKVFEALGASVDYSNGKITAIKDDTTIIFSIGSSQMLVNSESVTLDVPAYTVNDRTLIPLRAVSEALGCSVDWDGTNQKVTISTQG
jgi:uncharacterized protein YkwD